MPHIDFQDPFEWFDAWFTEAAKVIDTDSNAMTLATVDANGRPSARTVLLKAYDRDGFVFYTNANSRKGVDIAVNNQVALLFYWRGMDRQIRIEGQALPVSDQQSDAYFESRGRLSKIGAWASEQSQPIATRETLLERVEHFESEFPETVPRPPHWHGFRVVPDTIEFWNAGEARLHDRWVFERERGGWKTERLSP